jgi:hypothetical protein
MQLKPHTYAGRSGPECSRPAETAGNDIRERGSFFIAEMLRYPNKRLVTQLSHERCQAGEEIFPYMYGKGSILTQNTMCLSTKGCRDDCRVRVPVKMICGKIGANTIANFPVVNLISDRDDLPSHV